MLISDIKELLFFCFVFTARRMMAMQNGASGSRGEISEEIIKKNTKEKS